MLLLFLNQVLCCFYLFVCAGPEQTSVPAGWHPDTWRLPGEAAAEQPALRPAAEPTLPQSITGETETERERQWWWDDSCPQLHLLNCFKSDTDSLLVSQVPCLSCSLLLWGETSKKKKSYVCHVKGVHVVTTTQRINSWIYFPSALLSILMSCSSSFGIAANSSPSSIRQAHQFFTSN